ncbi:hypothetical protein C2G38_2099791 [Gigaspora rosea]|uniref:Uncharacterized protein n=1 Tax=Gigaspora rosea TaxID=44941 RepID=A0A397URN9_9GLOM|nr:hypothetical protein C2G38_2099791 [Gigaspora rosea]
MEERAYLTTGYCFLYCAVIYFIFVGFVENAKIGKIFVENFIYHEDGYIVGRVFMIFNFIMSAQAAYPYLKDQIIGPDFRIFQCDQIDSLGSW